MDTAFLRKTFALIAKGLREKEQLTEQQPAQYPYSPALQHGMNMFASASWQAGCGPEIAQYMDETAFLAHFITKPVADWFETWPGHVIDELRIPNEAFYACDAFAYPIGRNRYACSPDCIEFLSIQETDVMDGTDEHLLYEQMKLLDQQNYCKLRKFIIEHPIMTLAERRRMLYDLADTPDAWEAFQFAYEEITLKNCWRCPSCGWTMTRGKYGYACHSRHCMDITPKITKDSRLNTTGGNLYRLKKGIMRYFAAPGKWELEIASFCETKGLPCRLWPQMDRFDVEIPFSNGEVWEIDAKAYRNPVMLRTKIEHDNGFPAGDYARGYIVVPDEYTVNQKNYTKVVNRALKRQPRVTCVTMRALKTAITRKKALCHEE